MTLRSTAVPVRVLTATIAAGCAVAGAVLVASAVGAPDAGASITVSSSTLVVGMRGNGHGHGMSQYGARGAALAGLSARRIAAFYYPGTRVRTLRKTEIRVLLPDTGSTLTVGATTGLYVTGVRTALRTSGVRDYRLVSDAGTGERLQMLGTAHGAQWRTVRTGLPNSAEFHRAHWAAMRLYVPGGSSTDYGGYLRAVRDSATGYGTGVAAIDEISLDAYTAGVVPREMPASWPAAAVQAQALAARSYGRYAVEHPQSTDWDICATTSCQVFGGVAQYDATGSLLTRDYWPAVVATRNQVLTYRGQTIFAQFSASNGGWAVAGGQPYLVAEQDPYDNARSGDPYLYVTERMPASALASSFGLHRISSIVITKRDGHGPAGGRIVAGYVRGTTTAGATRTVQATGSDFQYATGAGTTWLTFRNG